MRDLLLYMQLPVNNNNYNNNNSWNLHSAFHDTQSRLTEKQIDKQETKIRQGHMGGMRRGDHEGVKAVLNRWVLSSFLKVVSEEASRTV